MIVFKPSGHVLGLQVTGLVGEGRGDITRMVSPKQARIIIGLILNCAHHRPTSHKPTARDPSVPQCAHTC